MITLLIIIGIYVYLMFGMYVLTEINRRRANEWHWLVKLLFIFTYPIWLLISIFLNAMNL
jgi:hypothetical protein